MVWAFQNDIFESINNETIIQGFFKTKAGKNVNLMRL